MARDDSDEFEVVSEQRGPKPKVTALTMILIFLNMAAALGFLYLMSVNFQRRQAWAFATFQRDLDIQGLPLKEEDEGQSGSRAALPRMRLTGESLREAFKKRGGPMSRVPEAFADLDEPFTHSVEPRYLTDDILKAHFGPYTPPVRTLEDEMVRLKTDFLASIEKAAKDHVEAVKKVGSEEKRRDEVRRVVLPTAFAGLVTGVMIATARIIGETAPLLVTTGVVDSLNTDPFNGRMQNLAVYAYNEYRSPGVMKQASYDRAWAAALVLIAIVMILNVAARFVYRRYKTEIR